MTLILNQTGTLQFLVDDKGDYGAKEGDWTTYQADVPCNFQPNHRFSGLKATERGMIELTYYTGFFSIDQATYNGYRFVHDQLGITFLLEICADPTGMGHHKEAKARVL